VKRSRASPSRFARYINGVGTSQAGKLAQGKVRAELCLKMANFCVRLCHFTTPLWIIQEASVESGIGTERVRASSCQVALAATVTKAEGSGSTQACTSAMDLFQDK
jgi:hypothetical protein